jgi:MFS family permease
MASTLLSFAALFLSVLTLLMGIGLLGTLLSLRLAMEGVGTQVVGLVMAAYFGGLICGTFVCHRLIQRVGHIRSFAAFAAVTTATVLIHGLYVSALAWAILRFFTGISIIGLYMVIESWLGECSEPRSRGRVFSIYMILTYLGMGAGQLLLALNQAGGPRLFLVAGILFAMSLVPVVVTRSVHPELRTPRRFSAHALLRRAPVGMLGCLASGLINSAFYTMTPVFGSRIGLDVSRIAWLMGIPVLGGLLLQWPVGTLSDRVDRPFMLSVLGALVAVVSGVAARAADTTYIGFLIAMGCFGGITFAVYPVAVARAHDLFEPGDVVAVSSALLLSYGVGATVGPIAASNVMVAVGRPEGLFIYFGLVGALFALSVFYFRKREKIEVVPVDEQVGFVPMRSTSPVIGEIDPRAAEDPDTG